MVESGTIAPLNDLTKMPFSASGLPLYFGSTSITTKYWFSPVYMVETSRWPKAS